MALFICAGDDTLDAGFCGEGKRVQAKMIHQRKADRGRVIRPPGLLAAALALALVQLVWAAPALSAPSGQSMKAGVRSTEKTLAAYSTRLQQKKRPGDQALAGLINELSTLRADSLDRVRQLTAQSDAANTALEQVKPANAETGKPVATDPVAAAKLRSLQKQEAAIEGLLVRAKLNANQADQLAQQVSSRRKALYFSTVFSRSAPPLSARARHRIAHLSGQIVSGIGQWIKAQHEALSTGKLVLHGSVALVSFFLLLVLASPFYGWLERRYLLPFFGAHPGAPEGRDRRLTIAFIRAVVRFGVFVAFALLGYFALRLFGGVRGDEARLVVHILLTLSGVVLADAMGISFLSPPRPAYRLLNFSGRQAANYLFFAMAALWVFAFDHVAALGYAYGHMRLSLETVQAQSAIVTLAVASLVLLAAVQAPLQITPAAPDVDSARRFRFAVPGAGVPALQFFIMLLALASIVSSLTGYVEFGRTLIWTLILVTLVLAGFVLIRHMARSVLALLWAWLWAGPPDGKGKNKNPDGVIMNIWLRLFADIALVVGGLWVFLHLANFRISDLNLWISRFFEGIPLGATVIRPVAIFWAVVAFMLVSLLFRALRAYLRQGMRGQSEMNAGANASILALVGYVGFVLALLVAFSALGLPFSNIALIASGLSLGIGFGLKDVANNFISGLILLFERPIKTGDWVVSSAGQGLVKNIGLRATEITTFDNASIMVPNSELVSAPLTNWTHKDTTGRIKLKTGVAYGTDQDLVRTILLDCGNAHESVLHRPPAAVYWSDFGESSLDFELHAFIHIRSMDDVMRVESDLRFAIYAAFAQNGVTIPFPQRDVHLVPPVATATAQGPAKKRTRRKPKTAS